MAHDQGRILPQRTPAPALEQRYFLYPPPAVPRGLLHLEGNAVNIKAHPRPYRTVPLRDRHQSGRGQRLGRFSQQLQVSGIVLLPQAVDLTILHGHEIGRQLQQRHRRIAGDRVTPAGDQLSHASAGTLVQLLPAGAIQIQRVHSDSSSFFIR